jgi:hypothetical protein
MPAERAAAAFEMAASGTGEVTAPSLSVPSSGSTLALSAKFLCRDR